MKESPSFRGAQAFDVACPPHAGSPVGVRLIGGSKKSLEQLADRVRFGALPSLFAHDISLFVEVAENRVQKAFRLEVEPQFRAVRRQTVDIERVIQSGAGVEPSSTVLLDQARVFVAVRQLGSFVDLLLKFLLQFCEAVLVRARTLSLLCL